MQQESPHPSGPVKMTTAPAKLRRPSPRLSEHAKEILTEIGYGPEAVKALEAARVIV